MNIIDAYWEKRNLRVDALEIEIEDSDSFIDVVDLKKGLSKLFDKNKHQYYVLKFDTGNVSMYRIANELDFQFAEVQFDYTIYKNKFNIDNYSNITRFNTLEAREYIDDEHYNFIISKISEGLFFTDRIALDPYFGIDVANVRYSNWVRDLIGKENYCVSIFSNNDEQVGFSINKYNNDVCCGVLGGLFKEYQNSGWGLFMHYANINKIFESCNIFKTTLSSNNSKVIKLWQYFSAEMTEMKYVYIKHI